MASHRITLKPGTSSLGVPAHQLLEDPRLRQPQIKCPLCETLVDVPKTLEQEIKGLATQLGGEQANILFVIHHPPDIPTTAPIQPIANPERIRQLKEEWKKTQGS